MNAARAGFLIAALAGIALAAVHLRLEQTRCASRVLALESQWVALRGQWWALQARTARLRTPRRIRDRVANVASPLVDGAKLSRAMNVEW